jgi:hypothetical protein
MMSVQLTAAGAEARSIMRWAWQDPQHRAAASLETIRELATSAEPGSPELAEIQDAGTMLSRLVGTLQVDSKSAPDGIGAQLSGPQTIGEQLDLAAIHGHHIPGTAFTTRHGWIPLIGEQLNDTSAAVAASWEKKKAARAEKVVEARAAAVQRGESPALVAKRYATVPNAQSRTLSSQQQASVRRHAEKIVRAQRAAERAVSPATARTAAGTPATHRASVHTSVPAYHVPPAAARHGRVAPEAVPELIRPKEAVVAPHPEPHGPPDTAAQAADVFAAAAPGPVPTPAHQEAVARGQAMRVTPGTVGEKLQQTDPALASLAAPGASAAALKAYVDARVAAEVARQVGQITQQQHDEVEKQLSQLHHSQQRTIAFLRKQAIDGDSEVARQDRVHLVAYSLFVTAGVGLAIAGIVTGIAPIAAALIAAIAPMAQIIDDYVRST